MNSSIFQLVAGAIVGLVMLGALSRGVVSFVERVNVAFAAAVKF